MANEKTAIKTNYINTLFFFIVIYFFKIQMQKVRIKQYQQHQQSFEPL
jgi:preprotein translocase subunit YajC